MPGRVGWGRPGAETGPQEERGLQQQAAVPKASVGQTPGTHDDPPSVLDGDPWPGPAGELSAGSEEPPVTPGRPSCALAPALAVREKGQGPQLLHPPRAPVMPPSDPWGLSGLTYSPRFSSLSPPTCPPPHLAPRPAGPPRVAPGRRTRLPKPAKSTRAPVLTAGAPARGKSKAGLPSATTPEGVRP